MASFRESSAATRIWPQVGFSFAMRTINSRISSGRDGRPGPDFQRQKNWKPFRCPTDQGVRFDNYESTLPVEHPRPQHESETSHVGERLRA